MSSEKHDSQFKSRRNIRNMLDGVSAVAMILASAAVIWAVWTAKQSPPVIQFRTSEPAKPSGLDLPNEPVPLSATAADLVTDRTVAVIVYSDFECPFCAQVAESTLPHIRDKYVSTGRLLLDFRHLPLPIHKHARRAAEAAECGREAGQFWEMHDALFQSRGQLEDTDLVSLASGLGLNTAAFEECLRDDVASARVAEDVALAEHLNIRGTPTFLFGTTINGGAVQVQKILRGAVPQHTMETVIDELLADKELP